MLEHLSELLLRTTYDYSAHLFKPFFEFVENFWHIIPRSYFVDGKLVQCTPAHILTKNYFGFIKRFLYSEENCWKQRELVGKVSSRRISAGGAGIAPFWLQALSLHGPCKSAPGHHCKLFFKKNIANSGFYSLFLLFNQRGKPLVTYVHSMAKKIESIFLKKNVDSKKCVF